MKPVCLLITAILISGNAPAQESFLQNNNLAFTAKFNYGAIWRHTKNFKPEVDHLSYAGEISICKQTLGRKSWEQAWRFPSWGIAASFTRFGNDSLLGNGFAIVPYFHIPLIRKKNFHFDWRVAAGLGYLPKPFDRTNNFGNDVIGSHINNCTSFHFEAGWKISSHVQLNGGAALTHFSNGHVHLPNLGINLITGFLTARYFFADQKEVEFLADTFSKTKMHWLFNLHAGIGWTERGGADGPTYQVYVATASFGREVSRINSVYTGLEVSYNAGVAAYLFSQEQFAGDEMYQSTRWNWLIADELKIGHFATRGQIGFYLYKTKFMPAPYYEKLGFFWYPYQAKNQKPFKTGIGVQLMTHLGDAEFVEIPIIVEW